MAILLCHLLGLAGCLAQHCTPGWGIPVELRPPLLGPGDQALDTSGRRLAGRSSQCSLGPVEERLHALQNKAWGWGQACSLSAFLPQQPRASVKRSRAVPGHFRAGRSPSERSCHVPWQGTHVSTVSSTCSLDTRQVGPHSTPSS